MFKLFKLAARNVARNKRRSALALTALVIGVGVMVALRGFINGVRVALLEGQVQGSLGALQVHKKGYLKNVQALPLTFDMDDNPALRRKLEAIPGVTGVAPRIAFGAMAAVPVTIGSASSEDQGRTAYFSAVAIDPVREERVTPKRWQWIGIGRMFTAADAEEIVLNQDFNRGLRAPLMAEASAPSNEQTWPALLAADRDGALNGANVRLTGTLMPAMPGDKRTGLVPLVTAQKLLRMEGRVTEYALSVANFMDNALIERVQREAQSALGPGYEVSTWSELVPFMRTGMRVQDFIFNTLSGVFLLVALLSVVNTMLMAVLERTREIGTMMAVGTRRAQIVALFILEGFVAGLAGGVGGALAGTGATLWMARTGISLSIGSSAPLTIWPFVTPTFVVISIIFAAIISSVAALYPAYRASRLRPVEALASL